MEIKLIRTIDCKPGNMSLNRLQTRKHEFEQTANQETWVW